MLKISWRTLRGPSTRLLSSQMESGSCIREKSLSTHLGRMAYQATLMMMTWLRLPRKAIILGWVPLGLSIRQARFHHVCLLHHRQCSARHRIQILARRNLASDRHQLLSISHQVEMKMTNHLRSVRWMDSARRHLHSTLQLHGFYQVLHDQFNC